MNKINIVKDAEYNENSIVVNKIRNDKDALIALAYLKPNQEVKEHFANADVSLLIQGDNIAGYINDEKIDLYFGDLITVPKGTKMRFVNESSNNANLVIIKAPNPGPPAN
jgi:mannose-6-phosphate isomerase-like protein (cupin superfamily)